VAALLALALVGLAATPAAAAPAAGTRGSLGAPVCTSPPVPGNSIAAVPWPQIRYDMAALSQITDGAGVTVAVLDSGVDTANPQLSGVVSAGGDLLNSAGDGTDDCLGHGTAVASIIAARPIAGAGLRGLAPGASILSIRVSERIDTEDGPVGSGNVKALIDGIRRAVGSRPQPRVINLSISTNSDSADLHAAIQSALDADIVVVAAVGNGYAKGNPTPYPAAYDGVVGVGAIGEDGARFGQSQVGPYVDIVAPGEGVVGAAPMAGHVVGSGTSYATPFVAATAALIRARWPNLNRGAVVRRLLATADPSSGAQPSLDYGYGVVNPVRALTEVLPVASAVPAATPAPVIQPGLVVADQVHAPSALALVATGILLLAALVIAGLAAAAPIGRRRGWRPGTSAR
jgi:type VII secretion-associated serine protease mycosin